jgi:catechol 2,3-dioxygenase-like lactoylglutathione lyase family enzyme
MALGHLGLNIADIGAAKSYYDRIMPSVGYEPFLADADQFAYRPADAKPGTYLFFYEATSNEEYSADGPGLQHLAFVVPTRQAVRDAADLASELGSKIVHPPQNWPQYPPPYYAGFWQDPNGFLLEAVCHHDR